MWRRTSNSQLMFYFNGLGRALHSFPTRRSSELGVVVKFRKSANNNNAFLRVFGNGSLVMNGAGAQPRLFTCDGEYTAAGATNRKSTASVPAAGAPAGVRLGCGPSGPISNVASPY